MQEATESAGHIRRSRIEGAQGCRSATRLREAQTASSTKARRLEVHRAQSLRTQSPSGRRPKLRARKTERARDGARPRTDETRRISQDRDEAQNTESLHRRRAECRERVPRRIHDQKRVTGKKRGTTTASARTGARSGALPSAAGCGASDATTLVASLAHRRGQPGRAACRSDSCRGYRRTRAPAPPSSQSARQGLCSATLLPCGTTASTPSTNETIVLAEATCSSGGVSISTTS